MWIYSLPQALFTTFGNYCLTLEDLVLMEMALPLFFKAFPGFNKLPVITIIPQLSPAGSNRPARVSEEGAVCSHCS